MSTMNGAPPGLSDQGRPILIGGLPVLFAFVQAPDGSVGFACNNAPPMAILSALLQWVEQYRFTAYQRMLGLEPKIQPARGLVVT